MHRRGEFLNRRMGMPADFLSNIRQDGAAWPPAFHTMIIVADWNRMRDIAGAVRRVALSVPGMNLFYMIKAKEINNTKLLKMFGFGFMEKGIILSLVPGAHVEDLKELITRSLRRRRGSRETVLSIPVSEIYHPFKREFGGGEMSAGSDNGYDLITAIVNQGYSDELVETANGSSTLGGTVIKARRIGIDEAHKHFGLSVQLEKEIVIMLVKKAQVPAVMEQLKRFCGFESEAKGIMFTVNIENLCGDFE